MVKTIPIVISSLALLLSGLTFYWTTLREKKLLYFTEPSRMYYPMNQASLQFVFFNGGKLKLEQDRGVDDFTE